MLDQALKIIQESSAYVYDAAARQFREAPVLEINESPPVRIRRIPVLCNQYIGRTNINALARHVATPPHQRSTKVIIEAWDDIASSLIKRDSWAISEIASEVFPHMLWTGSHTELAARFLYVAGLNNDSFQFVDRGIMVKLGAYELGINHLSIFLSSGRSRWSFGEQPFRAMLSDPIGTAHAATPTATALIKVAELVTPNYAKQIEHVASAVDVIGRAAVDALIGVGWTVVDAYNRPLDASSTIWDQARSIVVNATFDPTDDLRALLAGTVSERDLEIGLAGPGDPTTKYHAKRRARHLDWLRLKASTQRRNRPVTEEVPLSAQKYLQLQEMLR